VCDAPASVPAECLLQQWGVPDLLFDLHKQMDGMREAELAGGFFFLSSSGQDSSIILAASNRIVLFVCLYADWDFGGVCLLCCLTCTRKWTACGKQSWQVRLHVCVTKRGIRPAYASMMFRCLDLICLSLHAHNKISTTKRGTQ
jgi:hypothetical protein